MTKRLAWLRCNCWGVASTLTHRDLAPGHEAQNASSSTTSPWSAFQPRDGLRGELRWNAGNPNDSVLGKLNQTASRHRNLSKVELLQLFDMHRKLSQKKKGSVWLTLFKASRLDEVVWICTRISCKNSTNPGVLDRAFAGLLFYPRKVWHIFQHCWHMRKVALAAPLQRRWWSSWGIKRYSWSCSWPPEDGCV